MNVRCSYCGDTGTVSGEAGLVGDIPCPMCTEAERQSRSLHIPAAERQPHLHVTVADSLVAPGDILAGMSNAERKACPVSRGFFNYFPDAIALIARHSARSNEKHNPGEPLHWTRQKSTDHEDCIARHSLAVSVDPDAMDDGQYEIICRAWRAMAAVQIWAEAKKARGEKL